MTKTKKISLSEAMSDHTLGLRGCTSEEKEIWLTGFQDILDRLKNRGINVSLIEGFVNYTWIQNVCKYLIRKGGSTFDAINKNISDTSKRFYALEYHLHECFEILFLKYQGRDPYDLNLKKNPKNPGHPMALKAEFEFLRCIAMGLNYNLSVGALFENHPLSANTKTKDRRSLQEIGVDLSYNKSLEDEEAQGFYNAVENL